MARIIVKRPIWDQFERGEKTEEVRCHGRMFSQKTYWVGRDIEIGYKYDNKEPLLLARVTSFKRVPGTERPAAMKAMYPDRDPATTELALIGVEITGRREPGEPAPAPLLGE